MDSYALFISFFRDWDMGLVALQSAVTVLTNGVFFAYLAGWGLRRRWILAAAAFEMFCLKPEIDLTLISDSLFNNIFLLVMMGLTWPNKRQDGFFKPLLMSCGYGIAMLFRDSGFYFLPFLALSGYWVSFRHSQRGLVKCAAFLLFPAFLIVGIREWNRFRSGIPFITLAKIFILPLPVLEVQPSLLSDEETRFDKMAREYPMTTPDFPGTAPTLWYFHQQQGVSALEATSWLEKKFHRLIREYPVPYLSNTFRNATRPSIWLTNPFASSVVPIMDNVGVLGGASGFSSSSGLSWRLDQLSFWIGSESPGMGVIIAFYVLYVLMGAFCVVSAGLQAVFWGGGVFFAVKGLFGRGPLDKAQARVLLCWLLLAGSLLAFFSMLHVERRYLGVIPPLATASVALLLSTWRGRGPCQRLIPINI